MTTKFYMVFVEGEHTPTFKHQTPETAETEAKRLTEKTGKESFVLVSLKSFRLPDKFVTTELSIEGDDLPF